MNNQDKIRLFEQQIESSEQMIDSLEACLQYSHEKNVNPWTSKILFHENKIKHLKAMIKKLAN